MLIKTVAGNFIQNAAPHQCVAKQVRLGLVVRLQLDNVLRSNTVEVQRASFQKSRDDKDDIDWACARANLNNT